MVFWIRGELFVVENVPAGVCPQCGEEVVKANVGRWGEIETGVYYASRIKYPTKIIFLNIKAVMLMDKRISIDPKVCHGQACIKGTRIPVHQIIRMMANGDTIEELLEEYPSISREDILACLDYAASLAEEELTPID